MATVDDVQKDGFSIIWTIQNLSYCIAKRADSLRSPTFMVNGNEYLKWCLMLYPKGSYNSDTIGLNLSLLKDSIRECEVSFELAIWTGVEIFEQATELKGKFNSYFTEFGFQSTLRQKDLYKKGSGARLNNDSLTVGCRMCEMYNAPVSSGQCHIRTTIAVERNTYIWTITDFDDDKIYKQLTSNRSPITSEISSFDMKLTSTGGAFAEDKIQIEITHIEKREELVFSTCEMSLLGMDGKKIYSVKDEHFFDKTEQEKVWKLPFILKDEILSRKELYLPNGKLSLHCEFAVSSGAKYNEVECTENGLASLSKFENPNQEKCSDFPESLKDNLQCFYTQGKFSDITIRTPNKKYSVHKTILCARSEVFSAMFERDMKESLTGVIEIEDVDEDTISKMLLFLYTDTIEKDLEFGTSSSLYFAADKYGIRALKRRCSDFLKDNLTVANTCELLVLADRHQDEDLKLIAQEFVFEHFREIMDSEEWKTLMKSNNQLASETMYILIRRF